MTIVTKKLKEITELSGFLSSSSPFDSVIDNNSKEVDQAAVIATAVKVGTSLCCVCLCVCVCVCACMHTFFPFTHFIFLLFTLFLFGSLYFLYPSLCFLFSLFATLESIHSHYNNNHLFPLFSSFLHVLYTTDVRSKFPVYLHFFRGYV